MYNFSMFFLQMIQINTAIKFEVCRDIATRGVVKPDLEIFAFSTLNNCVRWSDMKFIQVFGMKGIHLVNNLLLILILSCIDLTLTWIKILDFSLFLEIIFISFEPVFYARRIRPWTRPYSLFLGLNFWVLRVIQSGIIPTSRPCSPLNIRLRLFGKLNLRLRRI